jgi:transposase
MFKWWHKVRDGTLSRTMFQRNMEPLERRVEALLEQAACGPAPKVAGTCVEILSVKDALWTFVDHEGVEPTNNESEREVRQGVIWRKMSLGSQSQRGSRYAERMLTVTATLRRQGRNVVDYLTDAIRAAQLHERPPSLLPSADLLATVSSTV